MYVHVQCLCINLQSEGWREGEEKEEEQEEGAGEGGEQEGLFLIMPPQNRERDRFAVSKS